MEAVPGSPDAVGAEGFRAQAWADAHEESSTSVAETRMDLHNNAVGRQIGLLWSDLGAGVLYARNNGLLCLQVDQC